ncbi:protein lacX [Clostridia bacterium]|nr:protein lacX [Clostridia bacterium]
MKDRIIKSDQLIVHVNPFGAELRGVERDGVEYLWQGDPRYYARTGPTLFPIVGRFVSDTYYVGDRAYRMPLNGFAMEEIFTVIDLSNDSIEMELVDTAATRAVYPFSFRLRVRYTVVGAALTVRFQVQNTGAVILPYGVGNHTAYRWPMMDGDSAQDAFLRFECQETLRSFNPFGWTDDFLSNQSIKPLSHTLFENFTRSLTDIQSQWVALESRNHPHGIRITREQFPFLAIWSLPDEAAQVICLEPCTSIHTGGTTLNDRKGIDLLSPGETRERVFSIEFF